MDSFVLKAIAVELDRCLRGGTVEKVFQPRKATVVLQIKPRPASSRSASARLDSLTRGPGKDRFQLLVSAESDLPRVHLSTSAFDNPSAPPPFCMLLRKHLTGARMASVALRGVERVLNLNFEKRDPVGRILKHSLVAEIMGRHSNLFLVDSRTGIVLDAVKAIARSRSTKRPVQRNMPYEPPPAQEKLDPLTIGEEEFRRLLESRGSRKQGALSAKWLVETFAGFSPDVAGFLARASERSGPWEAFRETRDRFLAADFSPGVVRVDERDEGTVWVLPAPEGKKFISFPSANAAADDVYGHSAEGRRLEAKRREVQKRIKALLERRRRTAGRIRKDLSTAAGAESHRLMGETLLANLRSVPRGAKSIRLSDPTSGEEVDISLDPRLSPQKNAQRCFARAKKLRRMSEVGRRRLKEVESQVARLEGFEREVERAGRAEALDEIAARLDGTLDAKGVAASGAFRQEVGGKPKEKAARASSARKEAASKGPRAASGVARRPSSGGVGGRGTKKKKRAGGRGRQAGVSLAEGGAQGPVRTSVPGTDSHEGPAATQAGTHGRRKPSSDYRSYVVEGQWEILVGRHNRGNDRLLRRVAGAEDLWLHAQGVPGSHVIIHHPERGKEVPPRVLEEAAKLAAFYSKGKESTKVAVDYTRVKLVRRLKAGKAGHVTYSGQRTIVVSPASPEALRRPPPPSGEKAAE